MKRSALSNVGPLIAVSFGFVAAPHANAAVVFLSVPGIHAGGNSPVAQQMLCENIGCPVLDDHFNPANSGAVDPCGPACTPAAFGPATWAFENIHQGNFGVQPIKFDTKFPPGYTHRPEFSFHTDLPGLGQSCNPATTSCGAPEPDPTSGPVFTVNTADLSQTPEPATFALIGTVLLGFGAARRKRK
jgi:hypothetical protein